MALVRANSLEGDARARGLPECTNRITKRVQEPNRAKQCVGTRFIASVGKGGATLPGMATPRSLDAINREPCLGDRYPTQKSYAHPLANLTIRADITSSPLTFAHQSAATHTAPQGSPMPGLVGGVELQSRQDTLPLPSRTQTRRPTCAHDCGRRSARHCQHHGADAV